MIARRSLIFAALCTVAVPALAADAIATADSVLTAADGRSVPIRITWPRDGKVRLPLLVLSHGANGTLDGLVLFQRSLTRERIVVAAQHPDSEANPDLAKVDRMKVFPQRVADMRLILDSVATVERLSGRRIDGRRIAAGGHSYGALVAQALGGAQVSGQDWRDARVKRVVAFSPPGPLPTMITTDGWAKMRVPQFVQTGTADVVPPIAPTWEAHMASFEAAGVPGSALWIGRGVDHYFGNRIQRLSRVAADQSAAFRLATDLADRFLNAKPLVAEPGVLTERMARK